MRIQRDMIRHRLEKIWPDVGLDVTATFKFDVMSKRRLELILQESKLDSLRYGGAFKCVQFSLLLAAEVVMYRKRKYPKARHPWAFGEADMMAGFGKHRLNIAVTTSGIYLVEPQTDRIWRASADDQVYRVRF